MGTIQGHMGNRWQREGQTAVGISARRETIMKGGRGRGMPHLLRTRARNEVVSTRALVSCDELWDVDRGSRAQGLHVRPQLLLQPPIQHLRAPHRLSEVQ